MHTTKRPVWLVGGLVLALAACQVEGTRTTPARVTAAPVASTLGPVALETTPGASAPSSPIASNSSSVTPTPVPSAVVSLQPTATLGALLSKPTSGAGVLSGHIAMDASYIVTNSGGSLISNHGSSVLAAGSVNLASSGELISDQGALLIAGATGNAIAGGSELLSENGGTLLSNNGGSLIANNGGGLIANNGGGVVANNSSRFALLDATTPTYGKVVPAAGIAVAVRSLDTGKLVPLGTDPTGRAVYAVYTNLSGGYEVYPQTGQGNNLLVEAVVPSTADPRQRYSVVAPAAGTTADIDEDTTLSSLEVRDIFAGHLESYFVEDPSVILCIISSSQSLSSTTRTLLTSAVSDLHQQAAAAGVTGAAVMAPAVHALALRCADAMLARMDVYGVQMGANGGIPWGAPGEHPEGAMQATTEVFKALREAAAVKLGADPKFFDSQSYFTAANACDPGRYTIKKPTDINNFLLDEYIANGTDPGLDSAEQVFVGVGDDYNADGVSNKHKLNAALDSLASALATVILLNAHGELDQVHTLIAAFDPSSSPGGVPLPSAPPVPCARPQVNPLVTGCSVAATAAAAASAATSATGN